MRISDWSSDVCSSDLDKPAFMAALKNADFKSVRGAFRFNNNNFPIQDIPVFEIAKDAKGRVSMRTLTFPLRNHKDAYHQQCPLKDRKSVEEVKSVSVRVDLGGRRVIKTNKQTK